MYRVAVPCIALFLALALAAAQARAEAGCAGWNTEGFFEAAETVDVERCLAAGADPNARTEFGTTPLHWAAAFNESPAVIAALLDAGADLKARTERGRTPLHLAAWPSRH